MEHTFSRINGKLQAFTEASDLGLPPGQFPKTLVVNDTVFNRLNVKHADGGDIESWTYVDGNTSDQKVLTVFND